jgi:hypothetical protein
LDELVHRYGLPHRIIKNLGSNFSNHQFWSTTRIVGLTSGTSQSPTPAPTDKSSTPTGWYSTPSRSDCTTQQKLKEASGSRNYPMLSRASYSTYQADRAVSLLPGLQLRSYFTYRRDVGIPNSRAIPKGLFRT